MKKLIFAGLLMFLGSVGMANALTVDFTVIWSNGNFVWGTGSFTGNDNNADGFISFNELTFFDGSNNIPGLTVDLADLYDTGDYNIALNQWLSNGVGWENYPDDAYFTWNNRILSINDSNASVTTAIRGVPEPATMLLFGAGLAGLGIMRKRMKG